MPSSDPVGAVGPTVLIAMPGTGSDGDYVTRAFGPAAARLGVPLVALEPSSDLVTSYLSQIDDHAAEHARILVGGVSIGAAVALRWALRAGADRCAGVFAALPAWTGRPETAVAASAARSTAADLRTDGLETTIAAMRAGSPAWLADELTRSWRALHPGLVGHLEDAADHTAPELAEIATLGSPLAIVTAADDPIHPRTVALDWASAAPTSAVVEITLEIWGRDPAVLGNSCAAAWRDLVR
ncbi:hypothetical protein [Gordonia soli]|uniref:AB hydrolase-1 domain-containing protein n=1 Tax=Gordonia soli NBRC 108243 TaxID=1223545 RepID=M0QNA1_9ACTN|nr:hypothetical protein [Gordonia soli]GAC68892.1 hypothetical protein GS4_19_00820 [Gordonia soli NBRC 108243]